jgi:hypothetical protein
MDAFKKDTDKEKEADNFAVKWTLSEEEEREITQYSGITENDVVRFAEKFNTHPAVIIGRLQHKGMISYSTGRNFIQPLSFES